MQLYEYALIRVVPRVEREEFINAGIILFCKRSGFLQCKTFLDHHKLRCLAGDTDIELIEQNLRSFVAIAEGSANAGPIAKLAAPERFRWLTATRSTIIQTGKVHPGFAHCETDQINRLFDSLVK